MINGVRFPILLALCLVPILSRGGDNDAVESSAAAKGDAQSAILKFKIANGLKCNLFAAAPDVANVVAFSFDEVGHCFVCETYRRSGKGVLDIRDFHDKPELLDEDFACKTVEDRIEEIKHLGHDLNKMSVVSERVRVLIDRDGDGKADESLFFADGFNSAADGTAAGILAHRGNVYFACIPNIWLLKDTKGDFKADVKKVLHYGYGVHISFRGHDLHGIKAGPDGRIYFSVGDRGANVTSEGKNHPLTDCGGVFRCNPDGSELEIFATGLRNPQCLTFDQYGNLFTGDNNSDAGDKSRWVYVVEGGDSGWRFGYQVMKEPLRGPFMSEKIWHMQNPEQPAYILPPCGLISSGPAGCTYYPGTGLPERYNEHFFLVDFTGGARAGVFSFDVKPKGASFEIDDVDHIIQEVLATHCEFGPDGGLYVSDWVEGWDAKGQGRIYRVYDPEKIKSDLVLKTKKLINEGMHSRSDQELADLLSYPDIRVRQAAQFELADRGSMAQFAAVAGNANPQHRLARLHAIWGMEQIARQKNGENSAKLIAALQPLLVDADAEVRAQSAKMLGERHAVEALGEITKLLEDASPRVRFFAANALAKLGRKESLAPVLKMLRENADNDPYLRHGGVMALIGINDVDALLAAAKDESPAVRMAVLLAFRHLERDDVAQFLDDKDPAVVLEAARAVHDLPLEKSMPKLAAMLEKPSTSDPLLRRMINANFRVGSTETAERLAKYAANEDSVEAMRVEALHALSRWVTPPGRDHVTGMWRPVPPSQTRDIKSAQNALSPVLPAILRHAPNSVRVAAAQVAEKLGTSDTTPFLELASAADAAPEVRVQALKTLAGLKDPKLPNAIKLCLEEKNSVLRREAIKLLATSDPTQAAEQFAGILEKGSLQEQQYALENLALLTVPATDVTISKCLDRLLDESLPRELKLDVLEAAAKHPQPEIREKVKKYEARRSKDDPLAPYRDALFGGDAAAGKKIFYDRQDLACVRCHTALGRGGDVGPNLTGIGGRQPREYLLESVMFPNKVIAKGFESITVKMADARVIVGTLKSENDAELVLNTQNEGAVKLKKSEIKKRVVGLSSMPEDIGQKLTPRELRDVVEFLASMK